LRPAYVVARTRLPNCRRATVGNSNSYTIAPADLGKQLRLVVSYTDLQGFPESVNTPVGTVTAALIDPPPTPSPTTQGLAAQYFNNTNLAGNAVLSRLDPQVNFNLAGGSPAPGIINADNYSARWSGSILSSASGSYTFYTISDDGVRLWVNEQLLINNWTDHAPTENSATINLAAGQLYSIKLEYYEKGGGSDIQLLWKPPAGTKQLIPAANLFSTSSPAPATGTLIASTTTTLPEQYENLILIGDQNINGTGNALANSITGNTANNIIDGMAGLDLLTGLAGADAFRFSTQPLSFSLSTADRILDFNRLEGDTIQIKKDAFGITASTASLVVTDSSKYLESALSHASLFVYDLSTGSLYWNENGSAAGAGAGGLFAVLENKAILYGSDITLA
jgi:hypothetical protein